MAHRVLLSLCLLLPLLPPPQEVLCNGFDLADALGDVDDTLTTTKAPSKAVPKLPVATKAPVRPKPKPAGDFDLADALDSNNGFGGKDKNKGQGGGFSDADLIDVSKDDTYKPDKGKGGHSGGGSDPINQYDDNGGTTLEVGSISGIVSAVIMALVGAVSSYISYQKKKLCFSIQQSLNTDMVKAENPTELQAEATHLQRPTSELSPEENLV